MKPLLLSVRRLGTLMVALPVARIVLVDTLTAAEPLSTAPALSLMADVHVVNDGAVVVPAGRPIFGARVRSKFGDVKLPPKVVVYSLADRVRNPTAES